MSVDLKQKRGRILGTLTRARRKAFVIIDNRGSRTQLTAIITELDDALGKLQEVNDELMSTLTTEEEHQHAKKYLDDAEAQHQDAINRGWSTTGRLGLEVFGSPFTSSVQKIGEEI